MILRVCCSSYCSVVQKKLHCGFNNSFCYLCIRAAACKLSNKGFSPVKKVNMEEQKLNALAKKLSKLTDGIVNENEMLTPVVISNCNASGSWTFDKATLDYDEGRSFPLCFWFPKGVESIIHLLVNEGYQPDPCQLDAIICLLNFLNEEKHIKCLEWLSNKGHKDEAEVCAVLAAHLFAPLIPGGNYKVGSRLPGRLQQCPSCAEKIIPGDTSLGNTSCWHGNADILVARSLVRVGSDHPLLEEDNEEDEWIDNGDLSHGAECLEGEGNNRSEQLAKSRRICENGSVYGNISDIETESDCERSNTAVEVHKKVIFSQVLAQTIVNAFCEVKLNVGYSNSYIPSFLATQRHVTILMYNCHQDKLLYSEPLSIWDEDSSLDILTIIHVWLFLNFEKFESEIAFEKSIPVSSFQTIVGLELPVYHGNVSKPCLKSEKTSSRKKRKNYALDPEFDDIIAKMKTLKENSLLIQNMQNTL